ncbi:DUF3891 family protein [Algoriphagus sp. NG3]|uniref:DUF3891 family protein n=1 Tax=Algoriphagus sp. NG3 TaxID=3097546 RepID=UPI002A7F10D6|nr:DUF3891 family protein [Algoriphagus sp. NG3]WPR73676.1 DUF3891 family protein [Algoriphagus sp. NG3]
MIVTPIDKGWQIIFHKSHALLAMDIGLNLDPKLWPIKKYWAAGLSSIGEHDNNQPKWYQRENLTASGAPLDYRQREKVDLNQAKSVAKSAKYKSSFIVLMVSSHFQKLYKDDKELEVQKFLEKMSADCGVIITNLQLDKDQVAQCYEFLRFCDDLSLALCQNDFENHKDPVEIDAIEGEGKILLSQLPSGQFQLHPWVFNENELTFTVEYFTTSTDFYKEDEELKKDLDLLHPKEKKFTLKKKGQIALPLT